MSAACANSEFATTAATLRVDLPFYEAIGVTGSGSTHRHAPNMSTDLVICVNSYAADQSPERHVLVVSSPDQAETVARLTAYYLNADISVDPPVPCQNWRDYRSAVRRRNSTAVFSTSHAASAHREIKAGRELLLSAAPSPGLFNRLLSTPGKIARMLFPDPSPPVNGGEGHGGTAHGGRLPLACSSRILLRP